MFTGDLDVLEIIMSRDSRETSQEGGNGKNGGIANPRESQSNEEPQEVIEILSDEDQDDIQPVENVDDATGNNESLVIQEQNNEDDDIQITGSNSTDQSASETGRIRRRGQLVLRLRERDVRRRTNNEEDDIEIIDERPAEQALSSGMNPFHRSLLSRFQENHVETPIGVFETNDNSSTSRSESENERITRSLEPRRRMPTRSSRGRRLRTPRMNDYVPLEQFILSQQLYRNLYGDFEDFDDQPMSDVVEGSVMARIERDNENAIDQRLQNENLFNRKALQNKKEVTDKELPGFTNDITPDTNSCCVLCGVILGEGIPEDFKANIYYNDNFKLFSKQYTVQAPWFCIKQCLPADFDLAKRVFVAKCGHVYCGRCVKNIGNRPPGRKKQNQAHSIENPLISAPKKCACKECNVSFIGKKSFTELYF